MTHNIMKGEYIIHVLYNLLSTSSIIISWIFLQSIIYISYNDSIVTLEIKMIIL